MFPLFALRVLAERLEQVAGELGDAGLAHKAGAVVGDGDAVLVGQCLVDVHGCPIPLRSSGWCHYRFQPPATSTT